jgi:hypothetical protein
MKTYNELMIEEQTLVDKARKVCAYEAGMMLLCWVRENASDNPSWRDSVVWEAIVSLVDTGNL